MVSREIISLSNGLNKIGCKFSIDQSDFERLKLLESEKQFTESSNVFFNTGKKEQWKISLSKQQRSCIEDFCFDEMKELNYL